MVVPRERHCGRVEHLLGTHPAVAILGARQVGKTTLAELIISRYAGPATRFDLEDPDDLARLSEPKLALAALKGLVVIDEVQRRPDLFPILRVIIDQPRAAARFLILGSASPALLQQTSETLAGRIAFHELGGFALDEVGMDRVDSLWLRGGFPRAFLAPTDAESHEWRRGYVQTFLERDIPQLGIRVPGTTLHRFWQMLAHVHGQVWNGAELARAFAVSESTVRRYLDMLTAALVVRQLPPWHENITKRQVKAPKVYVADTGVLHALLGVRTREDLDGNPKVGASWESFVLQQLVIRLGALPEECFFWATHAGAELDFLVIRGRHRLGFEIKRTTAPASTRSMHAARDTLGLEEVIIIHAGEHSFLLGEGIRAVTMDRLYMDVPVLP
jgi:predicted AAA+ superfamily ATPase